MRQEDTVDAPRAIASRTIDERTVRALSRGGDWRFGWSMNEELRSTAEELETSKEEMQSINEELLALNQELKNKVEEVMQAHSDLQNLFAATDIATLFLDRELRITRYTPPAAVLFNLIPPDRGCPLVHLRTNLKDESLETDAQQVLTTLVPVEREVQSQAGRWFLMRVRPYRTLADQIDGVVITFVDVTERKRAMEELQMAKEYAEHIIHTLHEALLVLTPDLRVQSANASFYTRFQVTPVETVGCNLYQLGNHQWDIPALHKLLNEVLVENQALNDFEVTHTFEQIGRRTMVLNARRLDQLQVILLAIEDITEYKQAEERFQKVVEHAPNGMVMINRADKIVLVNAQIEAVFGYTRAELLGQSIELLIPPPMHADHLKHRVAFLAHPTARPMGIGRDLFGRHKDGHTFPIEVGLTPIETEEGLMVLSTVVDITERKQAETNQAHLLQEVERQHTLLRTLNQKLATAQETERKALAGALHDRVGQNLTALGLTLTLIQNQLAPKVAREDLVYPRLTDAQTLVTQMTEQIRDVMADLHPPTLDDYGLLPTLHWYASQLTRQTGLLIHVQDPKQPPPRLGEVLEVALFRIAQEALTNVVKHAQATQVTVTLTVDDQQIHLQIADNGRGMALDVPDKPTQLAGWGILTMRERATSVGGRLRIEAKPGQGTLITVEVER